MEQKKFFHSLDSFSSQEEARRCVIDFFKDASRQLQQYPNKTVDIAYQIAGLMATNFAQNLEEEDPIDEILTIAGELETNPDNASELRRELLQKIEVL